MKAVKTIREGRLLATALVVLALVAPGAWAQTPAEIQAALDAAHAKYKTLQEGKNADYIPALAKVDPNIYGIALVTTDGKVYTAGDIKSEVSIQSISKVFTMAKVIEEQGPDAIEKTIGVDATGMRFNSIVAVEFAEKALGGPEINPLVNPGAITATSMVRGSSRAEVWNSILGCYSDFAGRPLSVNQEVFKSESDTNQRNQAIGNLMYAYEFIKTNPRQATDIYTEQCSVNVNAKDLAVMAGTLANGGKNPVTGKQVMKTANVPKVLAVMATAGLYDDSGKWFYHTGLPGKSGVGGGIIAVSPGKFGIAVISPPLDDAGNSVRAQKAIADISYALGGNPLAAAPPPAPTPAPAATQAPAAAAEPKPRLDIYGFAMLDAGYQTGQNDPNWYDVLRPTKLPSFANEFGEDGHYFAGVRQSRLGVKGFIPSSAGEIKTIFEFELFGTGVDAGQTTFRLRHAWGELGQFGAGQTWSPFMDPDVFPNSVEYWGPNGMVFFRNVQVRWTPWQNGDSRFAVALERPGASADQGEYTGRIELQDVKARFPLPDLSAQFRYAGGWGHVQAAGILRQMKWDDLNNDEFDLSGDATGWGINLSTNLKVWKSVIRASVAFGEGVQNYWNDAPVDVGIQNNFQNPRTPVVGKALPIVGIVAFVDLNWSDEWTSTVGYSMVDIDNSNAQSDNAYKKGQYALANLLYHPTPDVFLGPEIQWGKRENFRDGFTSDDFRIQFSAKYNFKLSLGGK